MLESRLTRREKDNRQIASNPVTHASRGVSSLPQLHVGTLELDGHIALKCECESDYALALAKDGRFELVAQPLPDGVVAYDLNALGLSRGHSRIRLLRQSHRNSARDGSHLTSIFE